MRMWEEIGSQLKDFAQTMREFGSDIRDVRERMIRIEAQDQPGKITKLEEAVGDAQDDIARLEREFQAKLSQSEQDAQNERQKIVNDHAADKLKIETRLTRMETRIAPLIALGSALIAAIATGVVAWAQGHFH